MSTEQGPVTSRFDLGGVPAHKRPKAWRDFVESTYYRCDIGSFGEGYGGSFVGTALDGWLAATIACDEVTVARRPKHFRDSVDAYFILVPTRRSVSLRQRGHELIAPERTLAFFATTEPYRYSQGSSTEFHSILVPGPEVRARKPDADDFMGSDLRASGVQQVFADFASSFCCNATRMDKDALRRTYRSVLDMLALVLERSDVRSNETTVCAAHRRRILNALEGGFRDPGCGLSSVSEALALSSRYVQGILAAHGENVSDLLRARRVAEACRLLERSESSRATVSTVAYAVGYSDPAYFSRVFRRTMGTSPSDYASRTDRS